MGQERRQEAADFLMTSVTKGSVASYRKKQNVFDAYRCTLPLAEDPGRWFEKCTSKQHRVQEVVLFYQYLYEVRKLREVQAAGIMRGLAFCVEVEGYDVDFFHSPLVARALKACARNSKEARAYNEVKLERDKNPVSMSVLGKVREMYWANRQWTSRDDVNAKGSWLAIALGFDLGARIGNVTRADGPCQQDHSIRGIDVSFEVVNITGQTVEVKGGEALRYVITSGHLDYTTAVKGALLTLVSSKTSRSVKTQMIPKLIGRRSVAENQLLDDLLEWMMKSGTLDSDELLTRYHEGHRRTTTRKDANTALKAAAATLGLNPDKYSSKSLRGGLATAARAVKLPCDELALRGGWAIGSKTPEKFYTTLGKRGRGGMAIGAEADLINQASGVVGSILEPEGSDAHWVKLDPSRAKAR